MVIPDRSDWSILFINLSYTLFDFVGRFLASFKNFYSRKFLAIGGSIRIMFVATSFLIALTNDKFWNYTATVIINCALLGLTNGFIANACCASIPARLDANERE